MLIKPWKTKQNMIINLLYILQISVINKAHWSGILTLQNRLSKLQETCSNIFFVYLYRDTKNYIAQSCELILT